MSHVTQLLLNSLLGIDLSQSTSLGEVILAVKVCV